LSSWRYISGIFTMPFWMSASNSIAYIVLPLEVDFINIIPSEFAICLFAMDDDWGLTPVHLAG